MKYIIYNNDGKIIAGDFSSQCNACFSQYAVNETIRLKCPFDKESKKFVKQKTNTGCFGLCVESKGDVNSSRLFRMKVDAFIIVVEGIVKNINDLEKTNERTVKKLLHNLTSINAHCIQEMFGLIPQEVLSRNISQQIQTVQDKIRNAPQDAAKAYLRIVKNNLAMKIEFDSIPYLYGECTPPELQDHNIRKVVLNILHPFFQDFSDKHVHVVVGDSNYHCCLDYNTFAIAIYHIVDNATKYIHPNTDMNVSFSCIKGETQVLFEMISTQITPEELRRIGMQGYSGFIPKKLGIAGSGMGIYRAKRFLEYNNAELIINPNIDVSLSRMYNSVLYQQNHFKIILR